MTDSAVVVEHPCSKCAAIPVYPRIELYPASLLNGAVYCSNAKTGLTLGYCCEYRSAKKSQPACGLSFAPARIPAIYMREAKVVIILSPVPGGKPAECSLRFCWADGANNAQIRDTQNFTVDKLTPWTMTIPVAKVGGVDILTPFSASLQVTLMEPGQKVLIRSVCLEVI